MCSQRRSLISSDGARTAYQPVRDRSATKWAPLFSCKGLSTQGRSSARSAMSIGETSPARNKLRQERHGKERHQHSRRRASNSKPAAPDGARIDVAETGPYTHGAPNGAFPQPTFTATAKTFPGGRGGKSRLTGTFALPRIRAREDARPPILKLLAMQAEEALQFQSGQGHRVLAVQRHRDTGHRHPACLKIQLLRQPYRSVVTCRSIAVRVREADSW